MLSIIIPIYNTPPSYIDRCLKSICRENYKDIEIILINDGSDDVSCQQYLESSLAPNVYVYTQTKKRRIRCKKYGNTKSKGEYIAFVDADDEIINGFLHKSSALAIEYNLDIVFGSIQHVPDIKHSSLQGSAEFLILQEDELLEAKKSILEKKTTIFPHPILGSPCARLYRAAICKKIGFNEKIHICEDQIFNLYALEESTRIGVYPAYWYKYYQNDFSAMHNLNGRQDLYIYYKYLKLYAYDCNNHEIYKWINIKLIGYLSGLAKQIVLSNCSLCQKLMGIKKIVHISILNEAVQEIKWHDSELCHWRRTELLVWKFANAVFKER